MKEHDHLQVDQWYERLTEIASDSDVGRRYARLVELHKETLDFYIPCVQAITEERAHSRSSDGRSIANVVAHVMAWEEWQIQVFTDLNREVRLREQMQLRGYYDSENKKFVDFFSVDDFNRYQAEKYSSWKWKDIQQKTIDTALRLGSLFPALPPKGWIDFLENTPPHKWKILPNKTITGPSGWYLWMVSLEHEAVEHRNDLIR